MKKELRDLLPETLKEVYTESLKDFFSYGKDKPLNEFLQSITINDDWKGYMKEVEEEVSEDFETNLSFHVESVKNYQDLGDKQTAELLVQVKEENKYLGTYNLFIEYFPEYYESEFEDDDMLSADVYFSEQEPQVVKVETISLGNVFICHRFS